MRWPFRRRGTPDPVAFLSELAVAHPGKRYTKMDKYRDFRWLFLGSAEGKRVLYEILAWGGVFQSSAPRSGFGTNETFFHDGQGDIALKLMDTMNNEPSEPKQRPAKPVKLKE